MHRRAASITVVLMTAALTGCAGSAPPEPVATASSPAAGPERSDASACEGFSDVLTITFNADVALREGRIEQQEHDGWYRVATRVLDRLDQDDSGAVADAVAALQDAAPPIASGASRTAGIGSSPWNEAQTALAAACEAAGTELAVEGFTGG
ncbi:MAG: hypothetical protein ACQEWM_07545 [Actinomycetota bacterium]